LDLSVEIVTRLKMIAYEVFVRIGADLCIAREGWRLDLGVLDPNNGFFVIRPSCIELLKRTSAASQSGCHLDSAGMRLF
jgi:hypothetical protein